MIIFYKTDNCQLSLKLGMVYLLQEMEHLVFGMVYLVFSSQKYEDLHYVVEKTLFKAVPSAFSMEKVRRLDKTPLMLLLAFLTNISCAVLTGAVGSNSSQHSMTANSTLLPRRLKR